MSKTGMTEIKHPSLSCQNIYADMGTGKKTAEGEQVTKAAINHASLLVKDI